MSTGSVIHKYKIRMTHFDMFLAEGSKIIDIAFQNGDPYMWVERPADMNVSCKGRNFEVYGTGDFIPEGNRVHLKTLHAVGGVLVLHFFEKI